MKKIQREGKIVKDIPNGEKLYLVIYSIRIESKNETKVVGILQNINNVIYDIFEKDFLSIKNENFQDCLKDFINFYKIKKDKIIFIKKPFEYNLIIKEFGELMPLKYNIKNYLFLNGSLEKIDNTFSGIFINKNIPAISTTIIDLDSKLPVYEIYIEKSLNGKIQGNISTIYRDNKVISFIKFEILNTDLVEKELNGIISKLSNNNKSILNYGDWNDPKDEPSQIKRFILNEKIWNK